MWMETLIARKKRGPAPTGKGTPVVVRMQPEVLQLLDDWISHFEPVSRPEAIRLLLQTVLTHPDDDHKEAFRQHLEARKSLLTIPGNHNAVPKDGEQ
jgi:hypothetical protein